MFHVFHSFLPYSRYYSVCFSFCTFFRVSRHISSPAMWVSQFSRLSVFSLYSRSYNVSFSFSFLVSFLNIYHILKYAFFFKIYLFIYCKYTVALLRHSRRGSHISLRMVVSHHVVAGIWTPDLRKSSRLLLPTEPSHQPCIFYLSCFSVSHHILCHTVFVSHFPLFSVFSTQSKSYSVYFSYFKFFTVSRHILGPKECVSHFKSFSVFLAIFQVIQWFCLIYLVFQFSGHNPGPTVCISPISHFSVFLPYSRSYMCVFHFPRFSIFSP